MSEQKTEIDEIDESGACRVCGGLLAHRADCSNLGLSAEDEFLMTYGEAVYRAALGLNGDDRG